MIEQSGEIQNRMTSQDQGECRICLQTDLKSNLLEPCECKGSQKYAHGECLKQWMDVKRSGECSVCKTIYNDRLFRKKPETFCQYLLTAEIATELLFMIFIYCVLLYLIIIGLCQYFFAKEYIPDFLRIILIVWTLFYVVLLIIAIFASGMKMYRGYNEWKRSHFTIELIVSEDLSRRYPPSSESESRTSENSTPPV